MSIDRDKDDGEGEGVPAKDAQANTQTDERDSGLGSGAVPGAVTEVDFNRIFAKELLLSHRLSPEAIRKLTDLIKEGRVQFKLDTTSSDRNASNPRTHIIAPEQLDLPLGDVPSKRLSSIPCLIDPTGFESLPPVSAIAGAGNNVDEFIVGAEETGDGAESIARQEEDSATGTVIRGAGVAAVATESANGHIPEGFADEGSGLLTGDFLFAGKPNNDKWMGNFGSIRPFKDRAEMEMINQLRELYAAGDREGVDRMLVKSRVLAKYRYNKIHESGLHNFSRPKERPPFMEFAKYFSRRKRYDINSDKADKYTPMNDESIVAELGSGFGAVADYFARVYNARVYAIDASEYAIHSSINEMQDRPYRGRVTFSVGDFHEALAKHRILVDQHQFPGFEGQSIVLPKFTHVYSQSSFHYNTPWNITNLLNSVYDSLEPGGLFGLAIKTNNSASARSEKHNLIYEDDTVSVCVDKVDKILRTYYDEEKIVDVIRSTRFIIKDMGLQIVSGYDIDGDEEELRTFVLERPASHHTKAGYKIV